MQLFGGLPLLLLMTTFDRNEVWNLLIMASKACFRQQALDLVDMTSYVYPLLPRCERAAHFRLPIS